MYASLVWWFSLSPKATKLNICIDVCYYYLITILLLSYYYLITILLLYYYYIITILLLYYYYIITILLLYYYYIITILLLYISVEMCILCILTSCAFLLGSDVKSADVQSADVQSTDVQSADFQSTSVSSYPNICHGYHGEHNASTSQWEGQSTGSKFNTSQSEPQSWQDITAVEVVTTELCEHWQFGEPYKRRPPDTESDATRRGP